MCNIQHLSQHRPVGTKSTNSFQDPLQTWQAKETHTSPNKFPAVHVIN